MIEVNGNLVKVSTKTLEAVLDRGALVSLRGKDGRVFVDADPQQSEALQLLYRHGETVPIRNTRSGKVYTYRISERCAEIRFDAWDGNAVVTVSEDTETGDLCIEPEVTSARQGVLACRYLIEGVAADCRIVAPLYQGVDMALEDPLLKSRRWQWPSGWEAGLCIFHSGKDGFWVHCEDDHYRAKALVTGQERRGVGFDTEAYGPIDRSMSAGGIVWRVNVFSGSWRVPAERYREWLWKAYSLEKEESRRAGWAKEIRMALSWCPTDDALLDELAKKTDPHHVLLHLPNWRDHHYDTCYPDFTPSDRFKAFLRHASTLGFHCMPHANSVDMDPSMPEYRYLSDFKYREVETGRLLGWGYENGNVLGVPSSNKALGESRDKLVMVKIHPGLAMWRAILAERIDRALAQLDYMTDAVFIDVTLCSYNLDNSLVDNTTSMEGMSRLIGHIGSIHGGLTVGGEGLNEVTFRHLSFAQAHLFDSHQATAPGLERCGGCDLNSLLFGRLCRTIGYSGLSGADDDACLRARIHEEHGAIPTITVDGAEAIRNPNAEVARVIRAANGG